MQEFVRISLNEISRSETGHCLDMTVTKGPELEQLTVTVSEKTASTLEAVLKEEPFSSTKPGAYSYEVQEISERPGPSRTLTLQIYKGRAQRKRNVVVEKDLFLTIWNIFHFQELPSKMPPQKRTR